MKIQTTLPFLMAGLLLAGCGGGTTTTTSLANTVTADAGSSYTGSRNTALLTLMNSAEFFQLVLGTESINSSLAARAASSSSPMVASTQEATPFQAERLLIDMAAERINRTRYQARAVDEVENCLNGGTTTLSGNLNEQTLTGTLQITYNQCSDGNTLVNGTAVFVIHSFSTSQDQPVAFTISMNTLEVRINQAAYRMTGTIRADLNTITGQTILTENLFRQDINTARQALAENVKIVEEVNGGMAISGKFCEGSQGCVTATTTDNLWFSVAGVPWVGKMVLNGAAGSQLNIMATSSPTFLVNLDGNGDGVPDAYFTSDGVTLTSTANPNLNPTSNTAPEADPGFTERTLALGGTLQLNASSSRDIESLDLIYQWTLETVPSGSTAKISTNIARITTFKPDKEGAYRISLKVTDPQGLSGLATINLNVRSIAVRQFSYNVVDAEYSDTLDRLIAVSTRPSNTLQIIDPATGQQQALPLTLPPTSVSVSPDGKTAVVGHNGAITHVDLQNGRLLKFFDGIGFEVFDIALGNNGVAYAGGPPYLQWDSLYAINLSTNKVDSSPAHSFDAGSHLQVLPRLNALYSIPSRFPSDLHRYAINTTPPTAQYDSPYQWDYNMGNNLWLTEDGLSILTAGGTMFQTTAQQDQDMRYQRKLADTGQADMSFSVLHADHSQEVSRFAVASMEHSSYTSGGLGAMNLKVYTTPLLNLESSTSLNNLTFDGSVEAIIPEFVFFNSNGTKRYAVLQQGNGTYLMGF